MEKILKDIKQKWGMRILFTLVFLLACALIVVLIFKDGNSNDSSNRNSSPAWNGENTDSQNAIASVAEPYTAELKTYKNSRYGFLLQYPAELSLRTFKEDGGGETMLFEHTTQRKGFQIFTVPYPEKDFIDETVLRSYAPGFVIENMKEIILPGEKHALLFWSDAPEIGRTREVWFIHNGYLFGITTYAELDEWLAQILSTLQFREVQPPYGG